ncbi:uncharacterized protein LOC107982137 [Nasonia vitripennis]|uniref:Uncharacterized protein n=1 Tax=Nasonia vitripennis TaxID=7425 RepID=A0A7M7J4I3_NASVI|nr:uncharacterized protein LOC107982137 [Nasonia vitripennis]
MLAKHWVVLIIAFSSPVTNAVIHNLVFSSIKQLFIDRSYHELTIFLNTTSFIHNPILSKALHEVPTIIIDLARFLITSDNPFSHLSAIREPRTTTMHMIFYTKTNIYQLHNLVNTIANLSPTSERPRCLLVQIDAGTFDQLEIEHLLRYVWFAYKFLDFSILSSIHEPHPLIFYYNPFTDLFHREYLDVNIHIFSDKLRNMHGTKIFVPIIHEPPFIVVRRSRRGITKEIDGLSPFVYKEIAKRMNFTLEFVEDLDDLESANRTRVLFKLPADARVNMSMLPLSMSSNQQLSRKLIRSRESYQVSYGLLLPNIQVLRSENPGFLDVYILSLCFVMTAHVLRFTTISSSGSWRTINLVQVLLGSSSPKLPSQTAQRIVYFA